MKYNTACQIHVSLVRTFQVCLITHFQLGFLSWRIYLGVCRGRLFRKLYNTLASFLAFLLLSFEFLPETGFLGVDQLSAKMRARQADVWISVLLFTADVALSKSFDHSGIPTLPLKWPTNSTFFLVVCGNDRQSV